MLLNDSAIFFENKRLERVLASFDIFENAVRCFVAYLRKYLEHPLPGYLIDGDYR